MSFSSNRKKGDKSKETTPHIPEDMRLMYLGRMLEYFNKASVSSNNTYYKWKETYGQVFKEAEDDLKDMIKRQEDRKNALESELRKYVKDHPLVQRLSPIRGMSDLQIAMLMTWVKRIDRFDTPSKFIVYCGYPAVIGDTPVNKNNLQNLRKNYKEGFGFNTDLSRRVYVATTCLIRQKGFFYDYKQELSKRLWDRAINEDQVFKATDKDRKSMKNGNVMKKGHYYMRGYQNFSLASYVNNGSNKRIAKIFMHLFYKHWREINGLPVRNPYPVDYLGHTTYVTLDRVLEYERNMASTKKKKKTS